MAVSMLTRLKRFAADESGATSIEYALIAVLVGITIIGAVTALGNSLKSIFSTVATTVDGVSS
jgi:pilus assembly protein Flp/PilA